MLMKKDPMKKIFLSVAMLALALSNLACWLPFVNRNVGTPVLSTEEPAIEDPQPEAQPPTDGEATAPEPSDTAAASTAPQVLSDNGVEITLPASYVLGNAEKDLPVLVEGLQALTEGSGQGIQVLYEQNKEDIVLWAYDTTSPSDHITSLLILKNEEFAGMPLALLSAFANTLLGDEVASLSQERLDLGGRDAVRFLSTAGNAGIETTQAIYLFNEAGKLWVVGFFTDHAQIGQQLPAFDAAVASINILPAE